MSRRGRYPFSIALLCALASPALAGDVPYRTVVVFGDTQHLVRLEATGPEAAHSRFLDMTRWVAANAESENIDFVLHVGDITENGRSCRFACTEATAQLVNAEWDRFLEGWAAIETAGIPYAIVPGNHDNVVPLRMPGPNRSTPVDGFETFFGRAKFQGRESHFATCDAATPDDRCATTVGHVFRFRLGDQPVLVAGLPDQPNAAVQDWFQEVLQSEPETPAILLSHQWLRPPFDDLWLRYLTPTFAGLAPLTEQVFMTVMGHLVADRRRIVALSDFRILAIEFDRQETGPESDAAIALIRFHFEEEALDRVDGLRLEPGARLVRTPDFAGPRPFSIANDLDGDGVPDGIDNCPESGNPDQDDFDDDGEGDVCDADRDADGVPNDGDNCAMVANPEQFDADADGAGNFCDADFNDDGEVNRRDLRILRLCRRIGPRGRAPRHDPECRESDMDVSGNVDFADLALFHVQCGPPCERRPPRGHWRR